MSDGVGFKKGCRLPSLHTEFQHESQESLVCKDDQLDQPYTPNIQAIESDELIIGLKELSNYWLPTRIKIALLKNSQYSPAYPK